MGGVGRLRVPAMSRDLALLEAGQCEVSVRRDVRLNVTEVVGHKAVG